METTTIPFFALYSVLRYKKSNMFKCIILITYYYPLICLCNDFYGLSAFVGCLSSVFIRRIIYYS